MCGRGTTRRRATGDVTILHFATASPMSAAFGTLPGRRVLYYHNVTPAKFFAPYDANLAQGLVDRARRTGGAGGQGRSGRRRVRTTAAGSCDALGFGRTSTVPILLDFDRLRAAPRVPALEWVLQDGLANILFVGRLVPNKRIEDHIRLAEHYKRYVDVAYRFIFVGRYDVVPGYYESIRAMVATYRMVPERFWFAGPVPDDELAAYYRNAHAYVSMSEHEGFCVPLVEAMAMDVPVLAYAEAAVPETLGGAGVSFRPKDLEIAAELLGGLIYDEAFRRGVIAGQRARVRDFAPRPHRTGAPRHAGDRDRVKIAFVVQRYGTEILGGLRAPLPAGRRTPGRSPPGGRADHLRARLHHVGQRISGGRRSGARRHRAAIRDVAHARHAARSIGCPNGCTTSATRRRTKLEWLKQQGPWAPGLVDYLQRHHHAFDVLVFFTYLYAPTVLGIKIAPSKSLLVPTAHDEPPIRLDMYTEVFGSAAAIAWNTEAERRFVSSRFHTARPWSKTSSAAAIDLPEGEAITEEADRPPDAAPMDTRAAASRISKGPPTRSAGATASTNRSCSTAAVSIQARAARSCSSTSRPTCARTATPRLMLMGVKMMPLPDDPHVRFAGMLPDEERLHALEAATVVVVPSPHESLSLLALEAMAVGTPVLVNARSEVLVEHCRQSNAGLYYADRWEFTEVAEAADARRAAARGDGRERQAVREPHYRWSSILRKYERLFARIAGRRHATPPRARAQPDRPIATGTAIGLGIADRRHGRDGRGSEIDSGGAGRSAGRSRACLLLRDGLCLFRPDVVPLDHLVQRRRLDVQELGGFLLDAAGGVERGFDVAALVADDHFAELDAVGRNHDVRRRPSTGKALT